MFYKDFCDFFYLLSKLREISQERKYEREQLKGTVKREQQGDNAKSNSKAVNRDGMSTGSQISYRSDHSETYNKITFFCSSSKLNYFSFLQGAVHKRQQVFCTNPKFSPPLTPPTLVIEMIILQSKHYLVLVCFCKTQVLSLIPSRSGLKSHTVQCLISSLRPGLYSLSPGAWTERFLLHKLHLYPPFHTPCHGRDRYVLLRRCSTDLL